MKKSILILVVSCFTFAIASAQSALPTAQQVLKIAKQKAKAEGKGVFLIYHASWCKWCKKLIEQVNNEQQTNYFTKNFVIAEIDVMERGNNKHLENLGGKKLLEPYHINIDSLGIPIFLLFNDKGKMIATSIYEDNKNLGCPYDPIEVKTFIEKLKKVKPMTADEEKAINNLFVKKEK